MATACNESDSSDQSNSSNDTVELLDYTFFPIPNNNALVRPLYALKTALQANIISDFSFEIAITQTSSSSTETHSIQVLNKLLLQNQDYTCVFIPQDDQLNMISIANGRYILHDMTNNIWFAIIRTNQGVPGRIIDATNLTQQNINLYDDISSIYKIDNYELYRITRSSAGLTKTTPIAQSKNSTLTTRYLI